MAGFMRNGTVAGPDEKAARAKPALFFRFRPV